MKNAIIITLTCLATVSASARETSHVPDLARIADAIAWKVSNATAELVNVDGKSAIRLVAKGDSANGLVGLALPTGIEFDTGVIEIELKGKNLRQRSFLGVAFNVVDDRTFEGVYFRPFNFRAEPPVDGRSVQYIAWPEHTWEHLRKERPGQFEKPVRPVPDPDGWFHARIKVTSTNVQVFVDDAKAPSLVVERLSRGNAKRPLGLFVDSADGVYANLRITPDKK
ncbi:hypothetical protein [Roseateles sp.]|uniref:hypothetical protein n=1 Tax=Roseateles sp. TaxID=1971397 RepID=UPI00286B2C62|nr:hypothetical protein [Roseateles sp.]